MKREEQKRYNGMMGTADETRDDSEDAEHAGSAAMSVCGRRRFILGMHRWRREGACVGKWTRGNWSVHGRASEVRND